MAKYLVETYYNCTFKVSHYLDEINTHELKNLEKRDDGKFEIIDVKLDNRKTKNLEKVGSASEADKQNDVKLNETSDPQDGKAAPYGSGFKPTKMTRKQIEELVWEVVTEKDDRCTRIAKRKYDTWPSAYASGAVVRCRRGEIWKGQK